MKRKAKNRLDVIMRLEEARTSLVIAAVAIRQVCGIGVHCHAEQLEGAAEQIQDWIRHLRNEVMTL